MQHPSPNTNTQSLPQTDIQSTTQPIYIEETQPHKHVRIPGASTGKGAPFSSRKTPDTEKLLHNTMCPNLEFERANSGPHLCAKTPRSNDLALA